MSGQLAAEFKHLAELDSGLGKFATDPYHWHLMPILGTILQRSLVDGQINDATWRRDLDRTSELHLRLAGQTAETIDAFIVENVRVAEVAKIAMSAIMLKACYFSNGTNKPLLRRSMSARQCENGERNWIHLLINIVRHAAAQSDNDAFRRLPIVSFNYDNILEAVLEDQFQNCDTPVGSWQEHLEIHHVHGSFGTLDKTCTTPAQIALDWARGVDVVLEKSPQSATFKARSAARNHIAKATNVYVAGFSFAPANCRLIGMTENAAGNHRSLHYCNFDGNEGVRLAARRYFRSSYPTDDFHIERRSAAGLLPICDWIKGGYIGELPG